MKKIILASAIIFAAGSAYAADAVTYEEPTPVVADTFSWTGGYIGVNAGYAGGKFKHPITAQSFDNDWYDIGSGSVDITSSGFIGGVQAGYNWQFDQTVVGIETDIQASGLKGEISGHISDGFDTIGAELGSKVKWFGTTRIRLGYLPTERFMIYATGGVAYGKVDTYGSVSFDGDVVGFSNSKSRVGYTIGAGAEYAINDNWTVKSEYLYTDLGKMKFSLGDEFDRVNVTTKTPFHTVRIGVNYKF